MFHQPTPPPTPPRYKCSASAPAAFAPRPRHHPRRRPRLARQSATRTRPHPPSLSPPACSSSGTTGRRLLSGRSPSRSRRCSRMAADPVGNDDDRREPDVGHVRDFIGKGHLGYETTDHLPAVAVRLDRLPGSSVPRSTSTAWHRRAALTRRRARTTFGRTTRRQRRRCRASSTAPTSTPAGRSDRGAPEGVAARGAHVHCAVRRLADYPSMGAKFHVYVKHARAARRRGGQAYEGAASAPRLRQYAPALLHAHLRQQFSRCGRAGRASRFPRRRLPAERACGAATHKLVHIAADWYPTILGPRRPPRRLVARSTAWTCGGCSPSSSRGRLP